MKKRGAKPKGKVKIKWSPQFAYAIGLIATDGNLSPNGRHINFTSKDKEQAKNYLKALNTSCHIGKKSRGGEEEKKYFVIQFGDVLFYRFLQQIGITPAKSKTLGKIQVPDEYFFDFLRGAFDGDGYSHSYWDKRWKSSFMYYVGFASASIDYIEWLRSELNTRLGVRGHVTFGGAQSACYHLKYAKKEGLLILRSMYCSKKVICLSRKRLKNEKILAIVGKSLG